MGNGGSNNIERGRSKYRLGLPVLAVAETTKEK